jgi:hypothetical protein
MPPTVILSETAMAELPEPLLDLMTAVAPSVHACQPVVALEEAFQFVMEELHVPPFTAVLVTSTD